MFIPVGYANFVIGHSMIGDAEEMRTAVGVDVSEAGGDYQQVVEDLALEWVAAWGSEYSDQTSVGPFRLEVGQDGGDPIIVEASGSTPGLNNDEPLPPNCAVLVQKQSASGGRRNRGRMYVPGLAIKPSTSPAGVIDSGAYSTLNSDATTFLIAAQAVDGVGPDGLVILHSEAPFTPTPITALLVANKIATQRRRLRP